MPFNRLSVLPEAIGEMRALSSLILNNNQLQKLPVRALLSLNALCKANLFAGCLFVVLTKESVQLFVEKNPLPSGLALNCHSKTGVQMLLIEAGALYQRHEACRRAVLALMCCRAFYRSSHRLLFFCPVPLVREMARWLWSTRGDRAWAEQPPRTSKRLFLKRHKP